MISLTIEDVQDLDRKAKENFGIPSILLMESAGRQVFLAVEEILANQPKSTQIIFVCGHGNNAGDGFVAARLLFQNRHNVTVFLTDMKKEFKGDAQINFNIIKKLDLPILSFSKFQDFKTHRLRNSPVIIVDAILGTGIKGQIKGLEAETINTINQLKGHHNAKVFVVSIDIPSGMNGNTGIENDLAVKADVTVTFVARKKGMLIDKSRPYLGRVKVCKIGIPNQLLEKLKS